MNRSTAAVHFPSRSSILKATVYPNTSPFNTYADCSKNLILINFQGNRYISRHPHDHTFPHRRIRTRQPAPAGPPQCAASQPGSWGSISPSRSPGETQPAASLQAFQRTSLVHIQLANVPVGTYNLAIKGENTLRSLSCLPQHSAIRSKPARRRASEGWGRQR
jgi:hypothetical protein